ncbi:hypothetical protein G9C98_007844 [Cotesia typhae]|uniref:Uncharacterized protein n=1 Tax=Cotesia typhae TaxID=2053667 RepID=A0A8J5QJV6_9HYME|nr:hypothetical protein G9C98_007844 [Cotesia typhae]
MLESFNTVGWQRFKSALMRKKIIDASAPESKLLKCLTTLDLTALSIGSTLGVGVYVLAGNVATSVVRALTSYIDVFTHQVISNAFKSFAKIGIPYFSPYVDFLAFGITVLFSVALAFGAKESSLANNICTFINLSIVLFVIITGSFKEGVNYGNGGFAPFGLMGIISGAGECFYGFIGFDCIATAGEEAKNPKKSLPIAIVVSLTIVFLAYFGISIVLTTVLPYYDQDINAPFIYMFNSIGWNWATYIVSVGAFCALTTSLVGALFPLPRIIYAMASDGLLYKWLGHINTRFHTPMTGTLIAGLFTGILSALFDLKHLSQMMSLGTLFSYSIVAACVVVLRYKENEINEKKRLVKEPRTIKCIAKQLINANNLVFSTKLTSDIVSCLITIYGTTCTFLASNQYHDQLSSYVGCEYKNLDAIRRMDGNWSHYLFHVRNKEQYQ